MTVAADESAAQTVKAMLAREVQDRQVDDVSITGLPGAQMFPLKESKKSLRELS